MEKKLILKILKELREKSPKRKFPQTIDLLANLKNLDLKKQDHKVDIYIQLPSGTGKKRSVCAFVDAQLEARAKESCDRVITKSEFDDYKNSKKEQRKLAESHDFFISQVEVMAKVASVFGKVLGSRGKMPNPKAGCVVPGAIQSLGPTVKKLQLTARLQTKNELSVKVAVGTESMKDEEIAENILAVYNALLQALPQDKNNIRYFAVKFTMGPLLKIEEVQPKK